MDARRVVRSIIAAVLMTALIPMGTFAGATDLFAQAGKVERETVAAETGVKLSPILIYDEDNLLKISIADVGKYHGDMCPNFITAFRATQLAIKKLWKNEIPKRGDFRIITANPGACAKDVFEFITRVVSTGDFMFELPVWHQTVEGPLQHHAPISPDCFRFTFIRKSTNDSVTIRVKEDVFPQGFFELLKKLKFEKTATPEQKRAFGKAAQEWKTRVKQWPLEKIFSIREGQIKGRLVSVRVRANVTDTEDKLLPILIYDEENLLKISIADVGKYHGDVCPCLIVGFRATQLAISQLWKDGIPKREDFKIMSAFPGRGSQDAFEFITRVKTRDDFTLQLPPETDIANISKDNLVFTFIQKSTGEQIKIWLKEEVFPGGAEEFFKLRKKAKFEKTTTLENKKAFESAKQELKKALMNLPLDKLFGFEKKVD